MSFRGEEAKNSLAQLGMETSGSPRRRVIHAQASHVPCPISHHNRLGLRSLRRHHRWLYPIDWRELSDSIRFRRAKGRCEGCGRPHGRVVMHLGDGRWWDDEQHVWRDGSGKALRCLPPPHSTVLPMRRTRVVLATAHRDHDPTNNDGANLAALCQRCHILKGSPSTCAAGG